MNWLYKPIKKALPPWHWTILCDKNHTLAYKEFEFQTKTKMTPDLSLNEDSQFRKNLSALE